jgi:hypothetical protein
MVVAEHAAAKIIALDSGNWTTVSSSGNSTAAIGDDQDCE